MNKPTSKEELQTLFTQGKINRRTFLRNALMMGMSLGAAQTLLAACAPARDDFERQYILRALAAQQGNMSRTADVLGVERSNLYRKMRSFGIAPRRVEDDAET